MAAPVCNQVQYVVWRPSFRQRPDGTTTCTVDVRFASIHALAEERLAVYEYNMVSLVLTAARHQRFTHAAPIHLRRTARAASCAKSKFWAVSRSDAGDARSDLQQHTTRHRYPA